jgi:hypothetical protein
MHACRVNRRALRARLWVRQARSKARLCCEQARTLSVPVEKTGMRAHRKQARMCTPVGEKTVPWRQGFGLKN